MPPMPHRCCPALPPCQGRSDRALSTREGALEDPQCRYCPGASGRGASRRGAARRGASRRGASRRGSARRGASRRGASRRGHRFRISPCSGNPLPDHTKSMLPKPRRHHGAYLIPEAQHTSAGLHSRRSKVSRRRRLQRAASSRGANPGSSCPAKPRGPAPHASRACGRRCRGLQRRGLCPV